MKTMSQAPLPVSSISVRGYVIGGCLVIFSLAAGFAGWAANTEIAGAVIANGTVVVDSSVKKVQHASGGIVGEIHVRDGDRVTQGALVIRLDETIARASAKIIASQIDELELREARLKSERDERGELITPGSLARRTDETVIAEGLAAERSLFTSRRNAMLSAQAQVGERIAQLGVEIRGITSQARAKALEIELIGKELGGLETLEAKQLVTTTKMMALRREAARLEGERAQLQSAAAQARGKIAELEIYRSQRDQELKTEIVKELREIQTRIAELSERRFAAEDQLRRTGIRAPATGIVHQLIVHTVGGVINPGEQIMLIVPNGEPLAIEAKISPHDIDQVRQGAEATLRFSAFNQRTTPEITGSVSRVAADLTQDALTGVEYFQVRIEVSNAEQSRLAGAKLSPGMPAEVQIRTAERTALSYLIKPVEDQFARAFRER